MLSRVSQLAGLDSHLQWIVEVRLARHSKTSLEVDVLLGLALLFSSSQGTLP